MDATSAGMIGKYQVIRVLGRGGMGEVLLAQDDLGRRVAIKRPFKSAMEDGLARFKLEARASTLSHPNIPVVYEMGMQDGLPFIAMEFVEGDPLDKLIASNKPLELITKLSIIEQVCSGLGHAHQKGIIHRDIKPANVIVQPNGVAKIIDFGIAKIQNLEQTSGLTQTSQIIGSLHYIAPERFKGEAIDGRVDIFSAGVMLYLLLTGNLPFGGGEATASYRIVNEAHTSLSSHIRDYPPALDGIMDQALAKDPEDRFPTAEDFADALHDVIEDLKKTRVFQLVDDAERLNIESRFAPALELLDEALKLDPANTQARKLRRFVREHQERQRRAERLREIIARAEEALAAENYPEALALLKEAQKLDATFPELAEKIQVVEEKKRRYELSVAALTEAAAAKDRGDLTAALRITEKAIQQDPENTKLIGVRGALVKQLETEALQGKVLALIESARREIAVQHFPVAEQLLKEAEGIDPSHPKIDELRRELTKVRESEERRQLLEEIHRRINEFLRSDNYEQAADLLNRAIDKLPAETSLHRLKVEVDTAARKFNAKQIVDGAIGSARELFPTNPLEALSGLQKAIEQMPGEERLVSYERTLRQEYESHRVEQLLADTLRKARDLISEREFEKAILVLETYQLESGNQADVGDLLTFARNELAGKQRRMLVERTTAEVRSLIRDERLEDAIRVLEPAIRDSGDATLTRLLEEVREQQASVARKLEVLQKRVTLLRENGELDEAVQVLQEHLALAPKSPRVQELLTAVTAERDHRQVTNQAITVARQATQRHEFPAALEALQAVVHAYGDSAELTREIQQVEAARAAYATEIVGKSIEAARAALLKSDADGALTALKSASAMMEFADAAKQADWKRIAQAAKKALQQPASATSAGAEFIGAISDAPAAKSRTPLILGVAGACVVLAGAGGFFWWKSQPAPQPVGPTEAHIRIAKAPPGALVSIDGGKPQPADANGELMVQVQPGSHVLDVSKDGFDPFTDKIQVGAGETVQDYVSLTKQPVAAKAGTFSPAGNLPEFKVAVDGKNRGLMRAGAHLILEEGSHKIRYSNPDDSDSQEHTIQIAAGQNIADTFTLKPPAPPKPVQNTPPGVLAGKLAIQTVPGAQIVVDGQHKATADGSGNYLFDSLPAGQHVVDIASDKYQPVQGRQVNVIGGQTQSLNVQLTPIPQAPTTGGLAIQTTAGATVSIDGQRKGAADGSGRFALDGLQPGPHSIDISLDKYQAMQERFSVTAGQTQTVFAQLQPVPQEQAVQPKPVDTSAADTQAIQEALERFEAAFDGRSVAKLQTEWLDIGKQRGKQLDDLFHNFDYAQITEKCSGTPTISGGSAEWKCNELVQFQKGVWLKAQPKTLYFVKQGNRWVMKDKLP
ncbi:protein kinase domain-containing protein [Acidicapsa acidisoli]|uniref:protein kinase domain-containing protein n=1 Tax=Acidicapsa acidisoli TaxID=1615681 RepID=UPI0021E00864|nr:protein kinase [Acidicapsa acidisoli]